MKVNHYYTQTYTFKYDKYLVVSKTRVHLEHQVWKEQLFGQFLLNTLIVM